MSIEDVLRQTVFVPPVPLVVAERQGFLDGVAVRTSQTRSSHEQCAQLMKGEQDLAVTAIDNLLVWNAGGTDITVLAQVERTTPLGLYVRPGISTVAGLAGRRLAVDAAANGFAVVARYLMAAHGVQDVVYLEVGGVRERLVALSEGAVDATLLGPPLDELAERSGFVKLLDVGEVLPGFPGQGLVARQSRLRELRPRLDAYLSSLQAAVDWAAQASPEQGVALLQDAGFVGPSARKAWDARPSTLQVPAAGLELLIAMRAQLGLLPDGVTDAAGLVETEALAGPRPAPAEPT